MKTNEQETSPAAGTLFDATGKSLINIRCANWRDKKETWSKSKQIEYYSKCMAQDCVQSLESGDSTPGCRFLDSNNHCYAYSSAQLWCAKNPTYKDCNDGGPKWGTPPIGSASSPEDTKVPHHLPGECASDCRCSMQCLCQHVCDATCCLPLPLSPHGSCLGSAPLVVWPALF